MNSEDRASIHILSIVTNDAVGDSRVLKSAESLAAAGYKVTLVAGLVGSVSKSEEFNGFTIRHVPVLKHDSLKRHTPSFPFNRILDLDNRYLPGGQVFVR